MGNGSKAELRPAGFPLQPERVAPALTTPIPVLGQAARYIRAACCWRGAGFLKPPDS